MSTEVSLAWGLSPIPPPLPLPCLVHSAPRRPQDDLSIFESRLSSESISLDLINSEESTTSTSATLPPNFPIYGLPLDSFYPWSLSTLQLEQFKSEIMQNTQPNLMDVDKAYAQTGLRSSSQIVVAAPTSSELSSSSSSNLLITPSEQRKIDIRAKHYSQNSRLTQQQHRQWWSTKSTPLESNINNPLKIAVAAEQRLYKESMKQLVIETCGSIFLALPELVEACLEGLFAELKSHAIRYPPFYTMSGALERSFSEMRQAISATGLPQRLPLVSIIQRRAVLHAIGTTFELPHIPTPFHSITLPRSGDFWLGLNQSRPIAETPSAQSSHDTRFSQSNSHQPSMKIPTFLKQVQIPVSRDAHIHRLLSSHPESSFVLSASTLCRIANPSIDVAWEVPIRVDEVLDEKGFLRKVIFLDKPLLPRDMSIKQKNEKFYKMSLKRWLLQNQQGMKMDATSKLDNISSGMHNESLASPDVSQGPDNLVYTEWKVGDSKLILRSRIDSLSCASRNTPQALHEPSNASSSTTQEPSSQANMSSSSQQAKSSLHHIPTSIVSKMKHVPDNQLEELSSYERTHYMLKTHLIGEDARILIGHVDPVTARLLSVEFLSHQQLKTPNTPSIETCFTQLHDILTWCKTLHLGTFLLSHATGEHRLSIVETYAKKEEVQFKSGIAAIYDLHDRQRTAAHSNIDLIEYLPPRWDYLRLNQIPNTFPPIGRSCCFDYLRTGKCNHPSSCQHLHITRYEAELRGISTPSQGSHADSSLHTNSPSNDKRKKRRNTHQQVPSNLSPKKHKTQ